MEVDVLSLTKRNSNFCFLRLHCCRYRCRCRGRWNGHDFLELFLVFHNDLADECVRPLNLPERCRAGNEHLSTLKNTDGDLLAKSDARPVALPITVLVARALAVMLVVVLIPEYCSLTPGYVPGWKLQMVL